MPDWGPTAAHRDHPDRGQGVPTPLRVWEGEEWPVLPPTRRIGWVDQKGRVYTITPDAETFDGGSLTALVVEVGD